MRLLLLEGLEEARARMGHGLRIEKESAKTAYYEVGDCHLQAVREETCDGALVLARHSQDQRPRLAQERLPFEAQVDNQGAPETTLDPSGLVQPSSKALDCVGEEGAVAIVRRS